MTFTVSQQWNTSRTEAILAVCHAFLQAYSISLPDHPLLQKMRNPIAIAMSAILHLVIIWAIFNASTFSGDPFRNLQARTDRLSVFDVQDIPPPPPPPPEIQNSDQKPKPLPAVRSSQVNVSATEALPPEWSKSLILITANSSPVAGTLGALDGRLNGGSNGGDTKGAFDPYAGAAPRRQLTDPNTISTANINLGADIDALLDQQAFKRWVQELQFRLQGAAGSLELAVVADNNGIVRSADILGGDTSIQVQLFIQSDVVGRQLFVRNALGTRRLPIIQL